jgi:thioredoxin-related protein
MRKFLLLIVTLLPLFATSIPDDKKLILLYVEMEHCPWCHKMDRETIDNPTYLQEIEREYILAKITKESGDMPLFITPKYYPTTYILSSDGSQILDELPGYMQSKRFVQYLQELYEVEMQTIE